MPALGKPYRPLIALPKKVVDIDPANESVSDAYFTAYDLLRTLVVAAKMVPNIIAIHAVASSVAVTTGPTLDAGVSKTAELNEPGSAYVQSQNVPQSEKRTDPGSDAEQSLPSQRSQSTSKQSEAGPETSDDCNKQSGSVQDPRLASQSSTLENVKPTNELMSGLDPKRASPDKMSRLERGLAPRPQSQLTTGPNKESTIFRLAGHSGANERYKAHRLLERHMTTGQLSSKLPFFKCIRSSRDRHINGRQCYGYRCFRCSRKD